MSLALKIVGLYCFVAAIYELKLIPIGIYWNKISGDPIYTVSEAWIWGAASSFVFCLVGFFLIWNSEGFSTRLCKSDEVLNIDKAGPQNGWYEFAMKIVGIAIILRSVPLQILYSIIIYIQMKSLLKETSYDDKLSATYGLNIRYHLINTVLSLLIGIALIAFAKKIAQLFSRQKKTLDEITAE